MYKILITTVTLTTPSHLAVTELSFDDRNKALMAWEALNGSHNPRDAKRTIEKLF